MHPFTPFVMEPVESRTMMSASAPSLESVAVVTDVHARSMSSGYLDVIMQSQRGGHGVTPKQAAAPAAAPSANVNRNIIPPAITNVVANPVDSATIELSWTKAHRAADTIVVDYSTDGSHFVTLAMLDKDQTGFTATGLSSGTYSFKLYAMNGKGSSAASEIVATVLG